MAINNITSADVAVIKRIASDELNNALDVYQKLATKKAIYHGQGTPLGLAYTALKLNGEAGEIAEHVGKAMRDDNLMEMQPDETGLALCDNILTPERRTALIKEVGDVLWYLSAICNELGCNLSEVAIKNIEKLADRSARGKLQGSGDNR